MKLYLAGGFSVMNVGGRERELHNKFYYKRLISFYDTILGNDIYQILEIAKNENISGHLDGRQPRKITDQS